MPAAIRFTDEATIEGVLVPFGSKDSYNTVFGLYTEFCTGMFPTRPLLWEHSLDPVTGADVIGRITDLWTTPRGLMMRATLDRTGKWFGKAREAIKRNVVGLSSGALAHAVKIEERTGRVLQWPIAEGSLVRVPAHPGAQITHHTVRADVMRSHFRSAGLPLDERALQRSLPPAWDGSGADALHYHNAYRAALRREARDLQRYSEEALRQEAREFVRTSQQLLLDEARRELAECRRLLDGL
jgi:hypothetical protein